METYFGADRLRFFIASNMPDVKRHMQRTFKDSIAIFGDDSRSSRDGVQFALLEFILLSHTSLLIHTFGSSFAVEVIIIALFITHRV